MANLKDLKIQFLEHLEIEKNRSRKTTENYGHYLDRFLQFMKSSTPTAIDDESVRKFRLFLNRFEEKSGKPLKKITQNYHIIALRAFLKYLAKRGVKTLAAERIELGRQEDREVTFLEPHELNTFLKSPSGSDISDLRDRAILEMLFSTGLRVSELCALDRDEIDLKRGEFGVRGKGRKLRVVFLSDAAKLSIKTYIDSRNDTDYALFVRVMRSRKKTSVKTAAKAKDSLRLTARSIERIIKKYATKAGIIGKKVSPHTLRHSFATDLLRNGADIRSVQALLGHSSVTTTQIYTHVTDKQLREVHEKFHGRKI